MTFEDFALKVLIEDLGLEAEKIDEEDQETPDFIALDENDVMFIELKEKDSSEDYLREREEAFNSGELYSSTSSLKNCKNVSNVVKKANRQIDSLASGSEFRIVWLHAKGPEKEALLDKFICSLYGKADIYDLEKGRRQNKECYYFDYSDFFKYRSSLDGAILSKNQQMILALNDGSPRYDSFKKSSFVKGFSDYTVIDPPVWEKEKRIWIADCDISRKDSDALLAYLSEKYTLGKPTRIEMQQCMVEFSMPHNESNKPE